MINILQAIPGLREAIDRERFIREQAFLDLPELVCGIEVQPLTLRRMLLLSAVGSPFIAGGTVSAYDVGVFFLALTGQPRGLKRWRLLRRVGLLNAEKTVAEIGAFFDESFQDSPAGGREDSANYYSFAAGMVDCFAGEYGWTEREILDVPVKRLFQCLKAMTKRNNPKAILFNPSDKVRGRWLLEQNQKQEQN